MSHRAALYKVQVRKKFSRKDSEPRLLGDFDEAGTTLIDALAETLENLQVEAGSGEKVIRVTDTAVDGGELRAIVQHGQTGVVADIRGPRRRYFHQIAEDEQQVKCASLFRLSPTQRVGALAVHINNNRGIIGLLRRGITERFREKYDDVTLDIDPVISASILEEAVDRDMIERVTLTRYEEPQDRAVNDTTKWVRTNEIGKLELNITAWGRGKRLMNSLLRRYRRDPNVFNEIVEFGGISFEQAKVEVVLPNNTHRTFNLERPDSGHPITEDLRNLDENDDGEPTDESLFRALRRVARDITG